MKMKDCFFLLALFSILLTTVSCTSRAVSVDDRKIVAKETVQIATHNERVKREGDSLLLKSRSGTVFTLKDDLVCEKSDDCAFFKFLDYFEDTGFYLVKGYYGKRIDHFMVSVSDGEKYFIHELPKFSPDKRRLIAITSASNRGYEKTGIYLWRVDGTKLIPEFSFEPDSYDTYKFKRWKNDGFIVLERWTLPSGGPCREGSFLLIDTELKMGDEGWKLSENFKPGSPNCLDDWSIDTRMRNKIQDGSE